MNFREFPEPTRGIDGPQSAIVRRAFRSSRGPCGFLGPLKPTCPRIPKDREERKREGTEAMSNALVSIARCIEYPSQECRGGCRGGGEPIDLRLVIVSISLVQWWGLLGRPDFVKMGQQRGKTTSFEDWLKIQREIEAR